VNVFLDVKLKYHTEESFIDLTFIMLQRD